MIIRKLLSPNDVGETGSHQAGIVVPKEFAETFFPTLDSTVMNPDCWLWIRDGNGREWKFRYVYYNNRLFGKGTRNEFRLTHMTEFLKTCAARSGDSLEFERTSSGSFRVSIVRAVAASDDQDGDVIVLSSRGSWASVALRR